MPAYVAGRIADALNERGLAVRGSRLLALGVTYKADVGDVRESAAVQVLAQLARRGARLSYHDPFVPRLESHGLDLRSTRLGPKALAGADAVLLLTPHSTYDLDEVVSAATLVFDARNAIRGRGRPNVVVL
jgi:UDP-N-acetyl-D-glucosamine dehydrogenase